MTWWDDNYDERRLREWLGRYDASDRRFMRGLIRFVAATSVLDCGGGLAIEYDGWRAESGKRSAAMPAYTLLDTTRRFLDMARARSIPVVEASIEAIPLAAASIDAVYTRHVLEHLSGGYAAAIAEMLRVARRLVCVSFFIAPRTDMPTFIDGPVNGLWHNRYARQDIDAAVMAAGHLPRWYVTRTGTILAVRL